VGKESFHLPKEKPRIVIAEKETLAGAEHELVVRIPLILGIGPIVVQPQVVAIAIELEDVRIAIGVRFCVLCHPDHRPSNLGLGCILFGSKTPPAHHTKSFLF
jgi:hypothetical protein|tara:strand:- start:324 stop:632 length:309 start_codon:yes stop_codon:yes gene_type:complete